MKKVLVSLALLATVLVAAPSEYDIKQLHGFVPVVDGNISEWDDSLFIDSLRSEDNIFAKTASLPTWTPAQFQYELYLGFTPGSTGFVYGAIKVTCDPDYISTGTNAWAMDNVKINPGGQAQGLYIKPNGTATLNQYCPYTLNTDLFVAALVNGNAEASLPTYEFAIRNDKLDPLGFGSFQMSFGSEEAKTGSFMYCAVGAEYTGSKQDFVSNPWDQSFYYPTFNMLTTAIETAINAHLSATSALSASPNPFLPTTSISYSAKEDGVLSVFNAAGKLVMKSSVKAGRGSIEFNAAKLPAGVYVAKLLAGKQVEGTRLFLTR